MQIPIDCQLANIAIQIHHSVSTEGLHQGQISDMDIFNCKLYDATRVEQLSKALGLWLAGFHTPVSVQ